MIYLKANNRSIHNDIAIIEVATVGFNAHVVYHMWENGRTIISLSEKIVWVDYRDLDAFYRIESEDLCEMHRQLLRDESDNTSEALTFYSILYPLSSL